MTCAIIFYPLNCKDVGSPVRMRPLPGPRSCPRLYGWVYSLGFRFQGLGFRVGWFLLFFCDECPPPKGQMSFGNKFDYGIFVVYWQARTSFYDQTTPHGGLDRKPSQVGLASASAIVVGLWGLGFRK